jgi:hypothetical protein
VIRRKVGFRTRAQTTLATGWLEGFEVAHVLDLPWRKSRAATTKLAASRFTSHSHGPGWTSSKSLTLNSRLRSGVAKLPKFV